MGEETRKNRKEQRVCGFTSFVKIAVLEETAMEIFNLVVLKGIRNPIEDGLVHALKLAMGCCAPMPLVKPTMEEVVRQLE